MCRLAPAQLHSDPRHPASHATDDHQRRCDDVQRTRSDARTQTVAERRWSGLPTNAIGRLRPLRLETPWRTVPCEFCGALLLQLESVDWCCKGGERVLPSLPPLPPRMSTAVHANPRFMYQHSRELNYLFCLSAIGVSEGFTEYHGP